jgi:hypothetical protein
MMNNKMNFVCALSGVDIAKMSVLLVLTVMSLTYLEMNAHEWKHS